MFPIRVRTFEDPKLNPGLIMNDFKPISHVILNVCLMPDETDSEGKQFNQSIVDVSEKLNALTPSEYLVNNRPNASIDSWAHCSVIHARVPNDAGTMASLTKALESVMGETLNVRVARLASLKAKAFIRNALIAGDKTNSWRGSDMYWSYVEKSPELLALQERIAALLMEVVGKDALITPRGEGYNPHFTLWIRFSGQNDLVPEVQEKMPQKPIPCCVRLGNCGPIGQVRNFVDKAKKLAELIAIPLEA